MLDFTSALYLGLRHSSASLEPWAQLSTGRPAALYVPTKQLRVAARLAKLTGCDRATLAASTLHLFWDLFGMLESNAGIYMDGGAYPIARWGAERAAARGIPVWPFAHYNIRSLGQAMDRQGTCARPVVVADSFCPACGRAAPAPALLAAIEARDGLLILDDTQAIGILGRRPDRLAPYGAGGGGSLTLHDLRSPRVLLVSSLAKAFGAGLAMLAGSAELVQRFEARSETRMHSSPPSLAVIHAAARALSVNARIGDRLRSRLSRMVARFRERLKESGGASAGGLFPVQTLKLPQHVDAAALHERLLRRGVQAVLHRARKGRSGRLSFIITGRHQPGEIDQAVRALCAAMTG
jgi:8-amino-7-oxononanoate synthase